MAVELSSPSSATPTGNGGMSIIPPSSSGSPLVPPPSSSSSSSSSSSYSVAVTGTQVEDKDGVATVIHWEADMPDTNPKAAFQRKMKAKQHWGVIRKAVLVSGHWGKEVRLAKYRRGDNSSGNALAVVFGKTVKGRDYGHSEVQGDLQAPVGVYAALLSLRQEVSEHRRGFGEILKRGSWEMIRDDKGILIISFFCLIISLFPTLWAPQWIALAIRQVYSNSPGSMPLYSFGIWLCLFALGSTITWAVVTSLRFVLQERFSHRTKNWITWFAVRNPDDVRQWSRNLRTLGTTDLPNARTFIYSHIPTVFSAICSVIMGFIVIFLKSWAVGLCALAIFLVFLIFSVVYDNYSVQQSAEIRTDDKSEDASWTILNSRTSSEQERTQAETDIVTLSTNSAQRAIGKVLNHVTMGAMYRMLAFGSPIALYLIAGRQVINRTLDRYEVWICAAYLAYIVMWAHALNGAIIDSLLHMTSTYRLMSFINDTKEGVRKSLGMQPQTDLVAAATGCSCCCDKSRYTETVTKAISHKRQQEARARGGVAGKVKIPRALIAIGFVFICLVLAGAIYLGQRTHNPIACKPVTFVCSGSGDTGDITPVTFTVSQKFQYEAACVFKLPTGAILQACADRLSDKLGAAGSGSNATVTTVKVTYDDWTGTPKEYYMTFLNHSIESQDSGRRLLATYPSGFIYQGSSTSGLGDLQGGRCNDNNGGCKNGAACYFASGKTYCVCPKGWTGNACDTPTCSIAATYPCQNNGVCSIGYYFWYAYWTCSCVDGYGGDYCEKDPCSLSYYAWTWWYYSSVACGNGGTCVPGYNSLTGNYYQCLCPTGWTGAFCSDGPCSYWNNPCGWHSTGCTPISLAIAVCTCSPGYGGSTCSYQYMCNPSPCQNGATCSAVLGATSYTCACPVGYQGATCQLNIDDCLGNLCGNGATCVDGLNSYTCTCTPYFTKDAFGYCTVDVNECVTTPDICGPGTCTNTQSQLINGVWSPGFECACQVGGNPLAAAPCRACLTGYRTTGNNAPCSTCAANYRGWPNCVRN